MKKRKKNRALQHISKIQGGIPTKLRRNKSKEENVGQGESITIEVVKLGADKKTPEAIQNVDITTGSKTIDVKEHLGYRASDAMIRAKTEEVLENKADLFKKLDDGEKVLMVADTIVGLAC